MKTDDRAVSPVLAYVLTLGISALLVAGLIIAAGAYVDTQREATTESELQVLGQQVSADFAAADRLARTEGATAVSVSRDLPNRVVGSSYRIEVRSDGAGPTDPYLELSSTETDVQVTVGLTSQTPIEDATVNGGKVVVESENGELVIRNV